MPRCLPGFPTCRPCLCARVHLPLALVSSWGLLGHCYKDLWLWVMHSIRNHLSRPQGLCEKNPCRVPERGWVDLVSDLQWPCVHFLGKVEPLSFQIFLSQNFQELRAFSLSVAFTLWEGPPPPPGSVQQRGECCGFASRAVSRGAVTQATESCKVIAFQTQLKVGCGEM